MTTEIQQVPQVLFMCLKDGGPLYQGDAPMVFEDPGDALAVIEELEEELEEGLQEGIVAEIKPATIVKRLRDAGIAKVHYQPSGVRLAFVRPVAELAPEHPEQDTLPF